VPSSPPELASWRDEVRNWLAANCPPTPSFKLPQNPLEVATDEQFVYLRDWQQKLYRAGYVGVEWPEEYGGRGFPSGYQRVVTREMTRAAAPFLVNIVGLSWAGPIILLHGTEAHKRDYLPKLLSAEHIWCQGFSEPEAGSDLASLRTSATLDGDDYVINGHKVWTTQAVYAEYCILLARSDPNDSKHAGISYFLAPMKQPGVEVQPLIKMSGEGGFNQVIWHDVRIPRSALLGREGQGWELAVATLSFERGASEGSAGSGGGPDRSVARLIEMARGLARDGQDLLSDPVTRDRLAVFAIRERANVCNAKRARIPALVADRPMAIPLMMKLAGTELDQELSDFGCELQGHAGALWVGDPDAVENAEWQRGYMNSFATTIAGGTSEILRNVLGEKVLGLPKSR
jgi:alkylation response protein AidB-like acyl-CoA dehydrogenase